MIELYRFKFDDGPDYRLTNADTDITHDSEVWASAPITRTRTQTGSTGEVERTPIDVSIDLDEDLAREWDGYGPTREVRLSVFVADRGDIAETVRQVFAGVVVAPSRSGHELTLEVVPRIIDFDAKGPRGSFTTRCRHALYGPGCRAHRVHVGGTFFPSVTVHDTDEGAGTVTIEVAPTPADDFKGGYIDLDGVERRIFDATQVNVDPWRYELTIAPWLDGLESASEVDVGLGVHVAHPTGVESVDEEGREVTVVLEDELDADHFVGGTLLFGVVGRPIRAQSGPVAEDGDWGYTLTLKYWIDDLDAEADVVLLAGCDRSPGTCQDRFGNFSNFGGYPKITQLTRSPFGFGWDWQ